MWESVRTDCRFHSRGKSQEVLGLRWVSALIRKLWTVAWDQWEHRNSILHERDSTKQHTLITQDTDRCNSRQFAMGVQGLPSQIIISSRNLWRSFSKHHCMSTNGGLRRRLRRHGNGRNAVWLSKQRSIPRKANSWQSGFSKGLGNTQHLLFSVVSSLSRMCRSSPYVQAWAVIVMGILKPSWH
jgi:hypothetical protein